MLHRASLLGLLGLALAPAAANAELYKLDKFPVPAPKTLQVVYGFTVYSTPEVP